MQIKISRISLIATKFMAAVLLTATLGLAVPQYIHYQGRLSQNGTPFTGTQTIHFTTVPSSALDYTANNVSVVNGIYSVDIPVNSAILQSAANLKLRVAVNGETLSPDMALQSVPYAFVSEVASTANYSASTAAHTHNAGDINAGTLTVARGGTNASSFTTGKILKYNGTALADSQIYDSGTNVGIGTTNPNYKLEVSGVVSANAVRAGTFYGSGSGLTGLIASTASTANTAYKLSGAGGTPATAVYVDNTGKVGIGKSNPGQLLDVNGTVQATAFSGSGSGLTNLNASDINNGTLAVAQGGTGLATIAANYIYKGNGTSALAQSLIYDNGTNVGIGKANPSYTLDVNGTVSGTTILNAVWNDLAEMRKVAKGEEQIPGKVYVLNKAGLKMSTKHCQFGSAGIFSDTYGFILGGKKGDQGKIPIAISGWVLAYVDKNYPVGTPLVSGKNGNLTKAGIIEKILYPERVLAIVDVGPEKYNNLKINGRIWVKVR